MADSATVSPPDNGGDQAAREHNEESGADGHSSTSPPPAPDEAPGEPLSTSWRKEPLTADEAAKVTQILHACKDHNRTQLIALAASSGGFIEDHVRRLAWSVLLGGDERDDLAADWRALPAHKDEAQVELDVHRAFVYYPTGESEKQIDRRKGELSDLITGVLRLHPALSYFQGYHDIAQVLLLVLGAQKAAPLLARLSLLRIRDFMLPTMAATNSHLQLLPAILYAADPALCKHLSGLHPFFALAATLTLYAHDIEEYGGIARLFDFLLAREAVISLYMYATIIMSRKEELLELEADDPDMLCAILCKLPRHLDLEELISRTTALFQEHPPESLPFGAWRSVSAYSVLKTTREPTLLAAQTLEEGETLLKKHSEQIQRQEAREKMIAQTRLLAHRYRRPASAITLAVFVGLLSLWMGRNGQAAGLQVVIAHARTRIVDLVSYTLAFVRR